MIKYYHDIIQGSDEWLKLKLGVFSASNTNIIVTPGGQLAKNEKMRSYACELASQREYPFLEDSFQSFDMQRGHIQEGTARDVYNDNYGTVYECGFITNDFNRLQVNGRVVLIGCSPDGLVVDDGGIEIKSRLSKFQISTINKGEVPAEYINQIQCCLLVTGRAWWDFVQYSNGMPFFVKRILPDIERMGIIREAIMCFEQEVATVQNTYREKSKGLVQCERVDFMADDVITKSEVA